MAAIIPLPLLAPIFFLQPTFAIVGGENFFERHFFFLWVETFTSTKGGCREKKKVDLKNFLDGVCIFEWRNFFERVFFATRPKNIVPTTT